MPGRTNSLTTRHGAGVDWLVATPPRRQVKHLWCDRVFLFLEMMKIGFGPVTIHWKFSISDPNLGGSWLQIGSLDARYVAGCLSQDFPHGRWKAANGEKL